MREVRIQLEGRVETVERAVWAWEAAAKSLRHGGWRSGTLFDLLARVDPGLDAAVAAVGRRVPDAPELAALLARLGAAKEQVRTQAAVALSRLGVGLGEPSLQTVLGELRQHHPILHQQRLGWSGPHELAVLGGTLLFWVGLALGRLPWGWALLALPLWLAVLWRYRRSVPVLLTQKSLKIGDRATALGEVISVRGERSRLGARFTVLLRDQPAWEVSCGGSPAVLLRQLRLLGIPCELTEPPPALG